MIAVFFTRKGTYLIVVFVASPVHCSLSTPLLFIYTCMLFCKCFSDVALFLFNVSIWCRPFLCCCTHIAPSSVFLFVSADSLPAAFNPFSSKCAPSLLLMQNAAQPQTSGPVTAPFEIYDKVISVAIKDARYYLRRRDMFVDLPLRVAIAARHPQTNLCEVIYHVLSRAVTNDTTTSATQMPLSLIQATSMQRLCWALAVTPRK